MRNLKIETLPNSKHWIDRDTVMLHTCFQILVDFVEKEDGLNHCNYEHHKESVDELKYLYEWWKNYSEEDEMENKNLLRLINMRQFLWT